MVFHQNACSGRFNINGITFFGSFHGIIDQIHQKTLHQIHVHEQNGVIAPGFQCDPLFFQMILLKLRHFSDQLADRMLLHMDRLVVVKLQQIHHLPGKSLQTATLIVDVRQCLFLLFFVDPHMQKRIRIADNGSHRRFQLVCQTAKKLFPSLRNLCQLLHLTFYLVCHLIKRDAQCPDLVIGTHTYTAIQLSLADRTGCLS